MSVHPLCFMQINSRLSYFHVFTLSYQSGERESLQASCADSSSHRANWNDRKKKLPFSWETFWWWYPIKWPLYCSIFSTPGPKPTPLGLSVILSHSRRVRVNGLSTFISAYSGHTHRVGQNWELSDHFFCQLSYFRHTCLQVERVGRQIQETLLKVFEGHKISGRCWNSNYLQRWIMKWYETDA